MGATQRTVNRTPSVAVVEAVASASGQSIHPQSETDGDNRHRGLPPLYETIDPDALNSLFDSSGGASQSAMKVEFTYSGYKVTVEGTGQVTVAEK